MHAPTHLALSTKEEEDDEEEESVEQVRDSLGNLDLSEKGGARSRSGAADMETGGADVEVGVHVSHLAVRSPSHIPTFPPFYHSTKILLGWHAQIRVS